MTLTVFGAAASPFVRKVRVVLAEKNLPYEHNQVSPFPAPNWFVEISPLKRIPVLRDSEAGDDAHNTLPDSSIICAYLEKKYPAPALYPSDPFAYAKALWVEEYADSHLATIGGGGVFRPVILSQIMRKEPDFETARDTIATKLPPVFDYLEKELAGRDHFVGTQMSIADISVATQFCNLSHAGYALDAAKWPGLAKFLKAMHARPSFAACMEQESGFFAKMKKLA